MKAPKTSAEAHIMKLRAKRQRMIVSDLPDRSPAINLMDTFQAEDTEKSAEAFLTLPEPPERGMGGEYAPPPSRDLPGQEDAVKSPDYVTLEASIERIALADRCGVFNLAFDTAEAVKAQDSTEQMLAHQMAAAHKKAMELLARTTMLQDITSVAQLANSAARLMDVYQKAMLTLNRIRKGGQQTVTVQHVQVEHGGQAVINGALHTSGGI